MVLLGKNYYVEISIPTIINLLFSKIQASAYRILDIFRLVPIRIQRILKHIYRGCYHFVQIRKYHWQSDFEKISLSGISYWWAEFFVLLLSLFGIAEVYEIIVDFIKFNTRPLTNWEKDLAKSVYGKSINLNRVRIDNLGIAGPRQYRFCYVSFFTINSWGDMPNHILIHELMHVWQYQKMGALYIPRALKAQFSNIGYNYGGVTALRHALKNGKGLKSFNLEQQADIMTDYYRIKEGYSPLWGMGSRFDLDIYEQFVQEL